MTTAIEWADEVWNPVTGCTKVSAGCKHCYAERLHTMRHQAYLAGKALPAQYAQPFEVVQLHPERLSMPAHWKKPRKIFVNSMSDLFHESVPVDAIADVFAIAAVEHRHTYMILTKRARRMHAVLKSQAFLDEYRFGVKVLSDHSLTADFPPSNVWLGVSAETQSLAYLRIPHLLDTPAAVRFVSIEPMLEPVDLWRFGKREETFGSVFDHRGTYPFYRDLGFPDFPVKISSGIDWVICGGETGPDARPMNVAWARALRDQCRDADVPFFYKRGGQGQGRELDGVRYEQFPG
jgi:protein gp37